MQFADDFFYVSDQIIKLLSQIWPHQIYMNMHDKCFSKEDVQPWANQFIESLLFLHITWYFTFFSNVK